MSKHTKGPWDLQKPMFGEQHIYVHSENSVDGKAGSGRQHICVLPYEGKKGGAAYHEMFNANARLIAAAPDLLEALRGLRDAFLGTSVEVQADAMRAARAAIAKAGGES